MSTRSFIAVPEGNGYFCTYCHHDGYPAHNGVILNNCVKTRIDALNLVSNTEIRYMDVDDREEYSFSDVHIYCFDDNRLNTELRSFYSIVEPVMEGFIDYLYIWNDKINGWVFLSNDDVKNFIVLDEFLQKQESI